MCSSLRTLFMRRWHTHSLCVVCLGARHAEAALEGADCPHCESLPLCLLRSRKAPSPFCWGGAAAVLVGFAERSDGGIRDERVSIFILTYHIRWPLPEFGSPPGGCSPRAAAAEFLLSSSEEVDVGNTGRITPSLSLQYEELLEVITRAVAKLNLDWPAERLSETQKG